MTDWENEITPSRLAWATGIGAAAAVAVTSALYLAGSAAGLVDERVVLPSLLGMGPMSLGSVAVTALVATIASGLLLGVLGLTTRRPVRNFRVVATALALASLAMPATIPGPHGAMRLTMAAMHVTVWAISIGVLATLAGQFRRQVPV